MKRRIAIIITFIAGSLPIIAFFTPLAAVRDANDGFENWMVIVSGFALLLGVVNVLQNHSRKIARREAGWFYSVVLLLSLFAMGGAAVAAFFGYPEAGIANYPDGSPTPFEWLSRSAFQPLQGTMFAMLAFYMASAAYRAFRVRSFQATLLLVAAVIVMLGRIPFGETLFAWIPGGERWLPSLTEWIMNTPNTAAQSGIIIGAALGAASMSLRVILGLETSYLGKGKEG